MIKNHQEYDIIAKKILDNIIVLNLLQKTGSFYGWTEKVFG